MEIFSCSLRDIIETAGQLIEPQLNTRATTCAFRVGPRSTSTHLEAVVWKLSFVALGHSACGTRQGVVSCASERRRVGDFWDPSYDVDICRVGGVDLNMILLDAIGVECTYSLRPIAQQPPKHLWGYIFRAMRGLRTSRTYKLYSSVLEFDRECSGGWKFCCCAEEMMIGEGVSRYLYSNLVEKSDSQATPLSMNGQTQREGPSPDIESIEDKTDRGTSYDKQDPAAQLLEFQLTR